MRKIRIGKVLSFVWIFGTIMLIPQILNIIIGGLQQAFNIRIHLYFNPNTWYDIMAIAFPCALTYTVIKQSEQQQKENIAMQKRMEEISARMLHMELESGVGYLRPYFSLKDAGTDGTSRQPYPYKLRSHINLVNSGVHDFFIVSVTFAANGKQYANPCERPLFLSKLSPYNEFCIDTTELSDELECPQIDFEIELVLKTTKGFLYKQLLFLGFENLDGIGRINKFNMEIQEMS